MNGRLSPSWVAVSVTIVVLAQGQVRCLEGFRPEGSKTTLKPNTMLDGLAAKNFEMDQVQPYSIASFAAILNFLSRSSIEVL